MQDIVIHVHLRKDDVGDWLEAHEQWGHTRAMEITAPTATPARRMIWSTGKSANHKSASQEEYALIFFLFFGNSKHLRIYDYFF